MSFICRLILSCEHRIPRFKTTNSTVSPSFLFSFWFQATVTMLVSHGHNTSPQCCSLCIKASCIHIEDVLVNVCAWTGLRHQKMAIDTTFFWSNCEEKHIQVSHRRGLQRGSLRTDFQNLPPFSVPSADVGYRSHCGCGPGPGCLYGILHLQEMRQQWQEAQKSAREESRTRPKEEGQGRRRGRGREGKERWGGRCVPRPPEVLLPTSNALKDGFYFNSKVERLVRVIELSTPTNASGSVLESKTRSSNLNSRVFGFRIGLINSDSGLRSRTEL